MRTLILLIACAVLLYAFSVESQTQDRGITLGIGRVNATVQEAQECYFHFSQGSMVVFDPHGVHCVVAREQIGKTGMLVFLPDP